MDSKKVREEITNSLVEAISPLLIPLPPKGDFISATGYYSTLVAVMFYATNDYGLPIEDCSAYGITFNCLDWDLMNSWER